ncbi:MAG: alpha-amylase [Lachnospiraceae bacterium]|nr:alpha-amylase [Lachnospiraceae bacterium]
MQNRLTLGVSGKKSNLKIAVPAKGLEWCNILIREKGGDWTTFKLASDGLYPSIFTGELKLDDNKEYEYIFECERGYFLDDRSRRVVDPGQYGKLGFTAQEKDLKKRNILSDTLGKVSAIENTEFDWKKDKRLCIPASDMIAYKLHVRGFTIHESSGIKHPGTFKGICEKLNYLRSLGITTLILQPCYEFNELMDYHMNIGCETAGDVLRTRIFMQPPETMPQSRLNFWGYGAQGMYFAPKSGYASEPEKACTEFKTMVRLMHSAGIEVIMEMDYSSDLSESFILDNLRFWTMEYHIDGFRVNVDKIPVKLIVNDPYLCNIKLIGRNFNPDLFGREDFRNRIIVSNDGFQDVMRRFLKGDEGQLHSASELIQDNGRRFGRLNYMADHDGFTLNDVFSYDERHNEANGEHNHDGREANYSWNCGAEGNTKKRKVLDLRNRMIKNAYTLLFLSQGSPMIFAGDEFGNTHEGNNNPYCCDNEQGWVIWSKSKRAGELKEFLKDLIRIRKDHPIFRNPKFLSGNDFSYTGVPDISFHGTKAWYPDFGYYSRTLGVLLNGAYAQGNDNSFLILINTHWEAHEFLLPIMKRGEWEFLFSTHSMIKSIMKNTHEQKELVPPRTICLYSYKEKKRHFPEGDTETEITENGKKDIFEEKGTETEATV